MNDICIRADHLSKRFSIATGTHTALGAVRGLFRGVRRKDLWVLNDVSFEVRTGEKLAVIGKNGAGKTTLARILSGIYRQTAGRVEIARPAAVLFRYFSGLYQDLSVLDNIYLFGAVHGMDRAFLRPRIGAIIDAAHLEGLEGASLKYLSAGQIQWLALTVFFQGPCDTLIFDEILAFLDTQCAQRCMTHFRALREAQDKTAVIISHDAAFLRRYCTTALWLDGGRVRMRGGIEEVIAAYERSLS